MAQLTEEWRQVPGFVGIEASSEGRIRKVTYGILKPQTSGRVKDYPRVPIYNLRIGGTQSRRYLVHELVARAFIGACPVGMQHDHKDGDKSNARPSNLEFVTRSQNIRHAIDTLGKKHGRSGAKHGMAKLSDDAAREMHAMRKSGHSLKTIAKRFDTCVSTVSHICHAATWKHLGLENLGDHRLK